MPRGSKAQLMHGTVDKTTGGLTKKDIKVVRKNGQKRYISKKKSKLAKKNLGPWLQAVKQAKKELGIPVKEFVLINKGKEGKELYKVAKEIYYD